MFLQETYAITDLWYYSPTLPAYTQQTVTGNYKKYNLNNPIPLPNGSFEIEFTGQVKGGSDRMCTLMFGEDINDYYYCGMTNTGLLSCISRNNNRAVLNNNSISKSLNTDYTLRIRWDGSSIVLYNGDNEYITSTNSEINKTYFTGTLFGLSAEIKEIKIKAL